MTKVHIMNYSNQKSFLQFYGLQRQVSFTGLRQRASQLAGPPSFLQFYGIATPGLTYSIERWTTITRLKLSGSALETVSVVHDDAAASIPP